MIGPQTLHRQTLSDHVLALIYLHHPAMGGQLLIKQLRQTVQVRRAEGKVDEFILLQNLFRHTRLLNHAAAHADQKLRLVPLQLLQPCDVSQRPALSVVPHAAGVEQHQIGLFPGGSLRHAHLPQQPRQLLAVMGVHLAAVGHHMIALGAAGQRPHLIHIIPLKRLLRLGHNHRRVITHPHSSFPFVPCRRNACREPLQSPAAADLSACE